MASAVIWCWGCAVGIGDVALVVWLMTVQPCRILISKRRLKLQWSRPQRGKPGKSALYGLVMDKKMTDVRQLTESRPTEGHATVVRIRFGGWGETEVNKKPMLLWMIFLGIFYVVWTCLGQ